jgi:t-SNARE complex subunit (syntaxin)
MFERLRLGHQHDIVPRAQTSIPSFMCDAQEIQSMITEAHQLLNVLITSQNNYIHTMFFDADANVKISKQKDMFMRLLDQIKSRIKNMTATNIHKKIRSSIQLNLTTSVKLLIETFSKNEISYQRFVRKTASISFDGADEEVELDHIDIGFNPQQQELAAKMHFEVEIRMNDIRSIAQQVSELHDMFNDIASMISEQEQLIDTIDVNIENADSDIVIGKDNLDDVRKGTSGTTSKLLMCILATVFVFGLIVIILISLKK